eukprot:11594925-Ditylum_brightwellii.AAC.1
MGATRMRMITTGAPKCKKGCQINTVTLLCPGLMPRQKLYSVLMALVYMPGMRAVGSLEYEHGIGGCKA